MKITFTVYTPDFLNASLVEELLKNNNIKYTTCETEKCEAPPPAEKPTSVTKTRRPRVTVGQLVEIQKTLAAHPDWHHEQVAQRHGISDTTVDRIADGSHVLLRGGA